MSMQGLLLPPTSRRIRIDLDPASIDVRPGDRTRLRLRIENPAYEVQEVALFGDPMPDGWSLSPRLRTLRLMPQSATHTLLRLDVPVEASPGDRIQFRFKVVGSLRPDLGRTGTGEAIVIDAPKARSRGTGRS